MRTGKYPAAEVTGVCYEQVSQWFLYYAEINHLLLFTIAKHSVLKRDASSVLCCANRGEHRDMAVETKIHCFTTQQTFFGLCRYRPLHFLPCKGQKYLSYAKSHLFICKQWQCGTFSGRRFQRSPAAQRGRQPTGTAGASDAPETL